MGLFLRAGVARGWPGRARRLTVLLAVGALGACGGGSRRAVAPPVSPSLGAIPSGLSSSGGPTVGSSGAPPANPAQSPGPSPSSNPPPHPSPSASGTVVDWAAISRTPFLLEGPWTGVHCVGDAALLCIRRNGIDAGLVELSVHPDRHPPGSQPVPYLSRIVADFQKGIAADRRAGCPKGSSFSARPVQQVAINQGVGLKSDYAITNASGLVIERGITYFALGRSTITNLTAEALVREGGCLPPPVGIGVQAC
ncbi:MAG: hypothetical protein NVSMB32_07650 [Actinomycetota bacterium]